MFSYFHWLRLYLCKYFLFDSLIKKKSDEVKKHKGMSQFVAYFENIKYMYNVYSSYVVWLND